MRAKHRNSLLRIADFAFSVNSRISLVWNIVMPLAILLAFTAIFYSIDHERFFYFGHDPQVMIASSYGQVGVFVSYQQRFSISYIELAGIGVGLLIVRFTYVEWRKRMEKSPKEQGVD